MPWRAVDLIVERLYLGNILAARSPRSLSDRRISYIVSVCTDPIPADLPASGIRTLRIPVEDAPYSDILIHLPAACQFIEMALSNNGTVLVHSVQGISRAPIVVAAYLMRAYRINANAAIDMIRRVREQICPDPAFFEQLVLFEVCRYMPSPSEGVYRNFRARLMQYRRELQERQQQQ